MENQPEQTEQIESQDRKLPRWFRLTLYTIVTLAIMAVLLMGYLWWYLHPTVIRTNGEVYGHRDGKPLTLDVLKPENPNGYGIAIMYSGSWMSGKSGDAEELAMAPLIRKGFTVFVVYHISQPEATVQEIVQDVNRSIRYIRHNAEKYGINPDRIGVSGGSAGGHLSLMLATLGGPGDPDAEDPIDRESSAIQAAAVFYPVTNLVDLGTSTENLGDGGPPKNYKDSFGPDAVDLEKWKAIAKGLSPMYHVSPNLPAILIYHGDKDTLVPLEQSEWFIEAAKKEGVDVELQIHPGGNHGWPPSEELMDYYEFANWFEKNLIQK